MGIINSLPPPIQEAYFGFDEFRRGLTLSDGTPRAFSGPAVGDGTPEAFQEWSDRWNASARRQHQQWLATQDRRVYAPSSLDRRPSEFRRTAERLENVLHGNSVSNLERHYAESRARYEARLGPDELDRFRANSPDARLAAQQAQARERWANLQTRPSSVDNPPANRTANTSGARAQLNATDRPRPAQTSSWQRYERIYNAPAGTPAQRVVRSVPEPPLSQARPRGIPGRTAGVGLSAAAGLLDFGTRVSAGQDYGSAAVAATTTFGGAQLGASLGAQLGVVVGPPGMIVGGLVGGALGAGLGSELGDQLIELGQAMGVLPGPARLPIEPTSFQSPPPFRGGQTTQKYIVGATIKWLLSNGNTFEQPTDRYVWGPITYGPLVSDSLGTRRIWYHFGSSGSARRSVPQEDSFGLSAGFRNPRIDGFFVRRQDGTTEGGDVAQSIGAHPLLDNPREPARGPRTRQHPGNDPLHNYYPGPLPNGGTQRGDSPDWVSSGRLAPQLTPPADNLGSYLPSLVPAIRPAENPTDDGNNRVNPGRTPGAPPATGGSGSSNWRRQTPTRPPVTARNFPGPTWFRREVPVTDTVGGGQGTTPPPPADPNNPCRGNRCQQRILDRIDGNGQALDNLMNLLQSGQLDAINAKLDSIDKKLGAPIPGGGISSFLKRLWDSLNLQRVINLLTFITTLHNAYMVSNALTQTLFSAFDQVLQMFRIQLRDAEGDEIDTSTFVGNSIESFFNSIFGTETVDGIQDGWKRFSRIYQAATNILYAMQSIMYSALDGLEAIADRVSVIGNALKKFGQVGERAYAWMNPQNNFMTSRFFRFTNAAGEAAELIETVAGSVVDIQETSAELANQTVELNRNLRGVDENGQPTAPPPPPVEFEPVLIIRQEENEESRELVNNIPPEAENSPPPPAEP